MHSVFKLAGQTRRSVFAESALAALDPEVPSDYRELAVMLFERWRCANHKVVGLAGGQGTGKSTLAGLIQAVASVAHERIVVLSIDDFYLTKRERRGLANTKHELFQTRGPPGTHAIEMLLEAINELRAGNAIEIPQFDKGRDDRVGSLTVGPDCDRVLVEGWCVGATAQPDTELQEPLNQLERERDPTGVWRRAVNEKLKSEYASLTQRLDSLVLLRVPDMQCVREWRLQQEQERPRDLRKDADWVREFVQHYQRVTEWMWRDVAPRADVCVGLDRAHRVQSLRFN